jgi:glucose-1-phosphate thymidylyltransferase
LLADNFFERGLGPVVQRFEAQEHGALIVLSEIAEDEHLRHLGVAELEGERIVRIVEKPDEPPSRLGATGLYFYDEQVWQVLPTLVPSGRGELEITDVINWYLGRDDVEFEVIDGYWGDAGESIDAYYEVNDFVRGTRQGRAL